jgi:hypothetical protein
MNTGFCTGGQVKVTAGAIVEEQAAAYIRQCSHERLATGGQPIPLLVTTIDILDNKSDLQVLRK